MNHLLKVTIGSLKEKIETPYDINNAQELADRTANTLGALQAMITALGMYHEEIKPELEEIHNILDHFFN